MDGTVKLTDLLEVPSIEMPPKSLICSVGSNRFQVAKEWIQVNLTVPCSAFTARYGLCARQVPYGPSTPEASTGSLPPRPFRLLPAGTTFAGRGSHPLRLCTFARRTE